MASAATEPQGVAAPKDDALHGGRIAEVSCAVDHDLALAALDLRATSLRARQFAVDKKRKPKRPYQGHQALVLEGTWRPARAHDIPLGTLIVPADQRLARVAATLLELSLRMQALAAHGEELASYGPAKPEAEEGLDEEIVGGTITGEPMIKGPNYTPDPTGRRTGEAPKPQTAEGACPHPPTATAHGAVRARRH